jgi:L-ascorbate metabolism protein UlaG (beta-lactamase superfamily)
MRVIGRRWWLGAGALGLGGAAWSAYRVSPSFWRNLPKEMQREVVDPPHVPDPANWPDKGLWGAWVGHSTVLMKIDGFTIVTDPVFSTHAGFHLGPLSLGIKRLVAPALPVDKLPRVDLILLSHAHMDHFDVPSLRRLESRRTRVAMAPETSDLFRPDRYGAVRELRWGEEWQAGEARVKAVEVNHWGARYRTDTYRGYNGYSIEVGRHRVLFAGDTANTESFRQLRDRRGFDFVIMPIGAYNPWIRYHCNPEQAWRMGNDAGAERFVPIHHQTFALGREPRTEPLERFLSAAGGGDGRVAVRAIGAQFQAA